ncbi:MAG: NAD(+)/NADH kinase [bacterium]
MSREPLAPIREIGVLVNLDKPRVEEIVAKFVALAERLELALLLPDGVAPRASYPHLSEAVLVKRADAVVVFGGDGTLLRAARLVAPRGIPILGVDAGTLGFLTEAQPEELESLLPDFVAGRANLSERMNLEGEVLRDGETVARLVALNDIVIGRGGRTRLARLDTTVGSDHVGTYLCDGLILSTPTGSTAYSLSAGGPIVSPNLRVILAVPICPHTLTVRPLVVSEDDEIRVRPLRLTGDGVVTVDGQETYPLIEGDTVVVRCAPFVTRLVVTGRRPFYGLLRRKFRWGEREA